MTIAKSTTTAAFCAVLTIGIAASGCGRKDQTAPVAETQTQTSVEGANQPATVIGCVRAGEGSDTFVLQTVGEQPVTYQLAGGETVNLREHVGDQVEVTGVITAEQRTATQATGQGGGEQPTGTSGEPQVRTQTQVNLRSLRVDSVRATGTDCK